MVFEPKSVTHLEWNSPLKQKHLHIGPLGSPWRGVGVKPWACGCGRALQCGSQASRCGQKLRTSAQFSAESLVRAPGTEHLGRSWVGKHHRPGLVPAGFFLAYSFHTMDFFFGRRDISVFEIVDQLLTLDKKNHTNVIPKGRMSWRETRRSHSVLSAVLTVRSLWQPPSRPSSPALTHLPSGRHGC